MANIALRKALTNVCQFKCHLFKDAVKRLDRVHWTSLDQNSSLQLPAAIFGNWHYILFVLKLCCRICWGWVNYKVIHKLYIFIYINYPK